MKVIAIAQHKGGTGKTTTTLNLGYGLARKGYRVVMIDMDSQANLTESVVVNSEEMYPDMYAYMTGGIKQPDPLSIKGKENLFLLPSSLDLVGAETKINSLPGRDMILTRLIKKLAHLERFQESPLDYVLIDCPPSMNILTLNALMASDEIIVPMQAETMAFKGLQKLRNVIESINEMTDLNLKISGILLTMFNKNAVVNREILKAIYVEYRSVLFSTFIRRNITLTEAICEKMSIYDYSPKSMGAIDYMKLTDDVVDRFY